MNSSADHDQPQSSLCRRECRSGTTLGSPTCDRSTRRSARALAHVPFVRDRHVVRQLLDKTHHGIQFGLHSTWLASAVEDAGWEVVEALGVAPRRLVISNRSMSNRSLTTVLWRALDALDRKTVDRARVAVVARRPASPDHAPTSAR